MSLLKYNTLLYIYIYIHIYTYIYNTVRHNFVFNWIMLDVIPATCFGQVVGPSYGWSLKRWSVQLIRLSIYEIENIINCTLHLFKDQPYDDPTTGPKHVAGITSNIIQLNTKLCLTVLYYILAYIQHNGDVPLENHVSVPACSCNIIPPTRLHSMSLTFSEVSYT